jgi:hypothetical protein
LFNEISGNDPSSFGSPASSIYDSLLSKN